MYQIPATHMAMAKSTLYSNLPLIIKLYYQISHFFCSPPLTAALDSSQKEKTKDLYERNYTYHLTPEQAQNLKEYIVRLRDKRKKENEQ